MERIKILLLSATSFEIAPTINYLENNFTKKSFFEYQSERLSIFPLCTGVGLMATAYALGKYNKIPDMSFAMQVGVAGAFNRELSLGEMVEISSERIADLGVEEADDSFTDVFELGLSQADQYPYFKGAIINDEPAFKTGLPKVDSLSVNKVHGTDESITKVLKKYPADVENMEGAAFFYACKMQHIKCVQIRSISNYVEKRNKNNWKIELAVESLNSYVKKLMEGLDTGKIS